MNSKVLNYLPIKRFVRIHTSIGKKKNEDKSGKEKKREGREGVGGNKKKVTTF